MEVSIIIIIIIIITKVRQCSTINLFHATCTYSCLSIKQVPSIRNKQYTT